MTTLLPAAQAGALAAAPAPVVNIANALTTLRLLLVPVFAGLLALSAGGASAGGSTPALVAALAVFALAGITDVADGHLARSRGLITRFGAVADPIADKTLTGTAFVGLSLLGMLAWPVTAVVLGRELAVTAIRFAVLRRGVIAASTGGKAKAFSQNLAVVVLLLPVPWAVTAAVLAVMVVLTVATGLDYAVRALRLTRVPVRG
jgi:CDP-diacylglycerol---glycerol-3-phosphate 3-phosphatidyltransferase